MPALEALQARFRAAHTATFGISVDSIFCHQGWSSFLGGISLPLLADFHPKGRVAESYGLYLADKGITDRATVIIDADGVVQHSSSVTPAGSRDIAELAALCEEVDANYGGDLPGFEEPPGLPAGVELFVKSSCGFSNFALWARKNLHLEDALPVHNITESEAARTRLDELAGKTQAPCLVVDGKPMFESGDIVNFLVGKTTVPML